MFFFYFLPLFSSGKKVKQNLFRIQRQQFLWLAEGRSPTLAVLLLITLLFYFIIFLNCTEPCQCYTSACLRPQEGRRLYSSPGYDFVTALWRLPDFEWKGRKQSLIECLLMPVPSYEAIVFIQLVLETLSFLSSYLHTHFTDGKPPILPLTIGWNCLRPGLVWNGTNSVSICGPRQFCHQREELWNQGGPSQPQKWDSAQCICKFRRSFCFPLQTILYQAAEKADKTILSMVDSSLNHLDGDLSLMSQTLLMPTCNASLPGAFPNSLLMGWIVFPKLLGLNPKCECIWRQGF